MSKKNTVKSFEDLFEQLEDIVKKMDTGDIELEESLTLFRRRDEYCRRRKKETRRSRIKN